MKKNSLIIGALIVLASACHKHDPVSVTFDVEEPTLNDTIAQGAELHFEGTIVGSGEMHGYVLTFFNSTTSEVIASYPVTDHSSSYMFHQHYVNAVTDTSDVICRLEVAKDDEGGTATKEVKVVCLP